jgi:hypothetical protein
MFLAAGGLPKQPADAPDKYCKFQIVTHAAARLAFAFSFLKPQTLGALDESAAGPFDRTFWRT